MGKKYIVKLGRCERLYKASIIGNGKPNLTWLSPEVDLTPYTEPDLEQVKADAYNDGYKAGREAEKVRQPDLEQVRKEAYQNGYRRALADVREENVCQTCVYFDRDENEEPCVRCPRDFLDQYTPKQERDAEIKVGDEVVSEDDIKAVVIDMDNYLLHVLDENGVVQGWPIEDAAKTDRHFSEIAAVLEKMRGEQDE